MVDPTLLKLSVIVTPSIPTIDTLVPKIPALAWFLVWKIVKHFTLICEKPKKDKII